MSGFDEVEYCDSQSQNELLTGLIASRILESELSATKKPKLNTQHHLHKCPHCDKLLVEKTYKKHKKIFCKSDGSWVTSRHESSEGNHI